MKKFIASLLVLVAFSPLHSSASVIPNYFIRLSHTHNIPTNIVYALALTESRTSLSNGSSSPWPYLINHRGKPHYFATQKEAAKYASKLIENGDLMFDVGLFQINWYWEGQYHTQNPYELFDVSKNGEVAITILKRWYRKDNDWIKAAGRYHNPANKNGLGDIYQKRFVDNLNWIDSQ